MVYDTPTGSREEGGNDTPPRRFISTEFAGTVEVEGSGTRPRFARVVVLLRIRNPIREHQTNWYVIPRFPDNFQLCSLRLTLQRHVMWWCNAYF